MERKVIRLSDNKIFNSLKEAANDICSQGKWISTAIKRKTKHKGSYYKHKEDEIFGEEWLPHPYLPIKVSNIGRIEFWNGRRTYGVICQYDYLQTSLRDDSGYKKNLRVHRLVAETWISLQPDDKPYVNHKDRDKQNNFVYNLEWCTDEENKHHWRELEKLTQLNQ